MEYWNKIADDYADEIMKIQPIFYKNAAILLDGALKDCKQVMDIGNGGVINYKFEKFSRLDCIDLSPSKTAVFKYAKYDNVFFDKGNILDLCTIPDNTYDAVIVQAVLHHLAGENLKSVHENVQQAIAECLRVLKPGGKLLIVESVVVPWFEAIEILLYYPMQLFFRLVRFDSVYQFSSNSLNRLVNSMNLTINHCQMIDLDRYIWIMRRKVLTRLTPCRAVWIEIHKCDPTNEL